MELIILEWRHELKKRIERYNTRLEKITNLEKTFMALICANL